jgi:hypothetical protein
VISKIAKGRPSTFYLWCLNFKHGCIAMRQLRWATRGVSFFTFFPSASDSVVLCRIITASAGSRSQKRMHTQRRSKNSTIDLCSFTAHFPLGLARAPADNKKFSRRRLAKAKFCFELLASFFAPISANTRPPNYSPLSSLDVHRRLLKGEGRDRVQA